MDLGYTEAHNSRSRSRVAFVAGFPSRVILWFLLRKLFHHS
jgi:hypothetical protein